MKVLVTGLTGLVGSGFAHYLREYVSKDDIVYALCRPSSNVKNIEDFTTILRGSSHDDAYLDQIFSEYKFDMLVHISNKHQVHQFANLCAKYNVKKVLFVSSTFACSKTNIKESTNEMIKYERLARETCEANHIDYIFCRPTSTFGTRPDGIKDRNISKFTKMVLKYPFFPLFKLGKTTVQPSWGLDTGLGLFLCYKHFDQLKNGAYVVAGDKERTFRELIDLIGKINNKKLRYIYVPAFLGVIIFYSLYYLSFTKIDKREAIMRLFENKAFSTSQELLDLGFKPHDLEEALRIDIVK